MGKKIGIGILSAIVSSVLTGIMRIIVFVPTDEIIEMGGLPLFITALVLIWLVYFCLLYFNISDLVEQKTANQTKTKTKTKISDVPPVMTFHANDAVTDCLNRLHQQLEKVKKLGTLDIETRHEIEKIERQLEESKAIYINITKPHQQEADNMLTSICSKMEQRLQSILDQHDQQQFVALEKIFLQQP